MKHLMIALAACLATAGACGAERGAAAYLDEGIGARWLGVGGAARAAATDVHAGYWNPAGLTRQGPAVWQVGSMFTYATEGRSTVSVAGSYLSDRLGAFGITWIRYAVDGLERVDGAGNVSGTENSSEDALLLSYGGTLVYQVRWGTTVKLLRQDLMGFTANGAAIDFGLLFQPFLDRDLFVAATATNLTSVFKWDTGTSNTLTRAFAGGVAYWTWRGKVLISSDIVARPSPAGVSFHAGAEVWPYREMAVRAGVNDGHIAGGATYFWKPYELDYAFIWDRYHLGHQHQISFLLHF